MALGAASAGQLCDVRAWHCTHHVVDSKLWENPPPSWRTTTVPNQQSRPRFPLLQLLSQ